MTQLFEENVGDVRTFAGNPIRMFLDNHILVTICSFHNTRSRSNFPYMEVLVHQTKGIDDPNASTVHNQRFEKEDKVVPRTTTSGRIEELHAIVKDCNLSISEIVRLLHNGFSHNFQSYHTRQDLSRRNWTQAVDFLSSQGFKYFHKKSYLAPSATQRQRVFPV